MIKQVSSRTARNAARGTHIRTVIFRDVLGTRHTLRLWDSGRLDARGCSYLHFMLHTGVGWNAELIFEGEDFSPSPMHADDSDATVSALLSFLTLCPGDIDAEYFASYTPEQLAWRDRYAQALAQQARDRFGDR